MTREDELAILFNDLSEGLPEGPGLGIDNIKATEGATAEDWNALVTTTQAMLQAVDRSVLQQIDSLNEVQRDLLTQSRIVDAKLAALQSRIVNGVLPVLSEEQFIDTFNTTAHIASESTVSIDSESQTATLSVIDRMNIVGGSSIEISPIGNVDPGVHRGFGNIYGTQNARTRRRDKDDDPDLQQVVEEDTAHLLDSDPASVVQYEQLALHTLPTNTSVAVEMAERLSQADNIYLDWGRVNKRMSVWDVPTLRIHVRVVLPTPTIVDTAVLVQQSTYGRFGTLSRVTVIDETGRSRDVRLFEGNNRRMATKFAAVRVTEIQWEISQGVPQQVPVQFAAFIPSQDVISSYEHLAKTYILIAIDEEPSLDFRGTTEFTDELLERLVHGLVS
jgi:hypothetical protein